jgi:hypothetical protein
MTPDEHLAEAERFLAGRLGRSDPTHHAQLWRALLRPAQPLVPSWRDTTPHAPERPVSNTRTTSRPLRSVPQPAQDGAMMLAAALGLALDQAPLQPGCARCVDREKRAGAAQPQIRVAVTWQDGQPVCYEDYEVSPDGGQ